MDELKEPEPELLKVIVPEGVIRVPAEESDAVAVQVVGAFTGSGEEQLTLVLDERLETERLKLPELVEWSVSPP